jgi:hypothetical protein
MLKYVLLGLAVLYRSAKQKHTRIQHRPIVTC